ncbi:bifunctional folylpolyglutamate synthase/dihydrofolate synthase [Aurantibacter sp.]|uniref:bifunctional folylpolyglutamate synthase/dihydrofolate synthase n=1 Tax=Aurantibacter sp. TaxID=2807103 RepID=UPI0035C86FC8
MTYQDTVNWMFNQLPMYQKQGKSAYKKDLSNTILLANYLDNPQSKFKSIHVAGTNGKGSTSHMLASVLQEAGYKVGLYTSPHLKDYRERIKINGKEISKQFVLGFIKKHQKFFQENSLSFFEMTVGLAFDYFSKKKVDIAIIEVGLGGRLDSTNIITPEVSVITNIGLDHTQFLGNTLELISKEKGGIIKPKIPVVVSETQTDTKPVFIALAEENNSQIIFADQEDLINFSTDLLGNYQNKNKQAVYQAIKLLDDSFSISEKNITEGLNNVVKNTNVLGRWQVLQNTPKVICDAAHNAEGLKTTMRQLQKESYQSLHIVFGVVNDKNLSSIVQYLPKDAYYYFCAPNIQRAMSVSELKNKMLAFGLNGGKYSSVQKALNASKLLAKDNDVIYVGGSTFVVAEVV